MSATYISFDDWREALRTDQRRRIEQLVAEVQGNDPHGIVVEHLNAARDAWYNDPGESERLIRLAQDQLKQEREWESERIAKLAAISARRGRRHDGR